MEGNIRHAHARWLPGFVCALRLWFDPHVAAADAACTVRFLPSDLAGEWRRAGAEVAKRLPNWPKPDRDCRELVVQLAGDKAIVTIVTSDGRRASRPVDTPDSLVAVASALAVSIAAEQDDPTPDHAAPQPVAPPSAPLAQEGRHTALVGAFGGARVGTPGAWLSPVARVSAGLGFGRWEAGVFLDWQPNYWLLGEDAPSGFRAWSMRAGLALGGRQPFGNVDVLEGVRLGVSFVDERSEKEDVKDGVIEVDVKHGAAVEPELGAYVGVAVGHGAGPRLRAQIEADLPVSRVGERRELDNDLPKLPAFFLGAAVGIEYALP